MLVLVLTTGLVVNSFVITSPTLAGERMLLIPKASILSEQIYIYIHILYLVKTIHKDFEDLFPSYGLH